MSNIKFAFDRELDKKVSIEEALKNHYSNSKDKYRCLNCGDPLMLIEGDTKGIFFKHWPNHDGHECDLYTNGVMDNSVNGKIIRLLKQQDRISFSLYLKKQFFSWRPKISFPSFSENDIEDFEKEQAKINIFYDNSIKDKTLGINFQNLIANQVNFIDLDEVCEYYKIQILSKEEANKEFIFPGFTLNGDLFRLIGSESIDEDEEPLVKKIYNSEIYLNVHYILVSRKPFINNLPGVNIIKVDTINVKKGYIDLTRYIYDIVFFNINDITQKLSKQFNVDLKEKKEVIQIMWPPIVQISEEFFTSKKYIFLYKKEQFNKNDTNGNTINDFEKITTIEIKGNKLNIISDNSNLIIKKIIRKCDNKLFLKNELVFYSKNELLKINFVGDDYYLFENNVLMNRYFNYDKINFRNYIQKIRSNYILEQYSIIKKPNNYIDIIRYDKHFFNIPNTINISLINKINNEEIKLYLFKCLENKKINREFLCLLKKGEFNDINM